MIGKQATRLIRNDRLSKLQAAFSRGGRVRIDGIDFDFSGLTTVDCGLNGLEAVHLSRLEISDAIKAPGYTPSYFGLANPPCLSLPWLEAAPPEALKPQMPLGFGWVREDGSPLGARRTDDVWDAAPYDLSGLTRVLKGDRVVAEWLPPLRSKNALSIEAEKTLYRFKFLVWRQGKCIGESKGDLLAFPKVWTHRDIFSDLVHGYTPSTLSFLDRVHVRIDRHVEPSRTRSAIEADIKHLRNVVFENDTDDLARRKADCKRLRDQNEKWARGTYTPWDGLEVSRASFLFSNIALEAVVDEATWAKIEVAMSRAAQLGYDLRCAEEGEKILPEAQKHQARREAGAVGGMQSGVMRSANTNEWVSVARSIVTDLQAKHPDLSFSRVCELAVKPLQEKGFSKKARTIAMQLRKGKP